MLNVPMLLLHIWEILGTPQIAVLITIIIFLTQTYKLKKNL